MTPRKGTKVAKVKEGETGLALSEYGEDAGAGFEDVTQADLIIPFLNVLQKMSDLVDEEHPSHVAGAKAGMLMNSVTEELHPGQEGILFIPVHKTHKFVEWVPRDQGGGFVGVYEVSDPMVMEARKGHEFGKVESPDGNDLVETFYMFGLVVDVDGGYNPAVIAFSSTQIKAYKKWMTTMRSVQLEDPETGRRITPPMFSHLFRVRTRHQENAKGSWHGLNVNFAKEGDPKKGISPAVASRLSVEDELYQAAKECRGIVVEEGAKVSYETSGKGGEGGDGADDGDDF